MNDLNQCQFIGRLGKDVELRFAGQGDAVANFSLACGWKTKTKEGTEWINVTVFGKLGEIAAQYLKKGSQVYISGRMRTEKYTGKDGIEKYGTKIIADTLQMLGGKDSAKYAEPDTKKQEAESAEKFEPYAEDDIPF
jgi:single-strand DNA-binding protein